MSARPAHSVLILGTGLTGLAAAHALGRRGYEVTLLDHPSWQDDVLARPPHRPIHLLGCHRETWNLLRTLETDRAGRTETAVPLEFRLLDGRIVRYGRSRLPRPLHWMIDLLRFGGLSWRDRRSLLSYLEQVWERAITPPQDLDNRLADDWLASIGQSRQAREAIWHPLAQWLTGNPLVRLSAAHFVEAMSAVFLGRSADSAVIQLGGTWEDRLVVPLRAALHALGVQIRLLTDAPRLQFDGRRLSGVQLSDGVLLQADRYLAAIPHRQLRALISEQLLARFAYFSHLSELTDLQDLSVQLTLRSTDRASRLVLLAGQPFHQATFTAQGVRDTACRLSATDNASLFAMTDPQVIDVAVRTLHLIHPDLTADRITPIGVFRREQAALALQPGVALRRPLQQSPIENLAVAGAWTDTGWPSTIESALVSVRQCVERIDGTKE